MDVMKIHQMSQWTLNMDEVVGHIHSCVVTDLNISEKGTGVAQKPRPVVQKQYSIPTGRWWNMLEIYIRLARQVTKSSQVKVMTLTFFKIPKKSKS